MIERLFHLPSVSEFSDFPKFMYRSHDLQVKSV
jgi:hypothetical protein